MSCWLLCWEQISGVVGRSDTGGGIGGGKKEEVVEVEVVMVVEVVAVEVVVLVQGSKTEKEAS